MWNVDAIMHKRDIILALYPPPPPKIYSSSKPSINGQFVLWTYSFKNFQVTRPEIMIKWSYCDTIVVCYSLLYSILRMREYTKCTSKSEIYEI